MDTIYLPKWLYEIKPFALIVVGLGVAIFGSGRLAVLSGMALALIGAYLWYTRRGKRRKMAERQAAMEARLRRERKRQVTDA